MSRRCPLHHNPTSQGEVSALREELVITEAAAAQEVSAQETNPATL